MHYTTMVFDIKSSRSLKNREEVQNQLIKSLKKCNELFKEYIEAPFLIILGDEWQGLLKNDAPYIEIINFFKSELPEIDFYTGVGIGDVTVHDFDLTVNQLDGPSFYLARKAIKYAKKNNCTLVLLIQ